MFLAHAVRASRLGDSLGDATPGDRTVGRDVVGLVLRHLAEDGAADLHRVLVELGLDPVSAVMAGAALDSVDGRSGNPFQRFPRLLADVLHARVTGNVI